MGAFSLIVVIKLLNRYKMSETEIADNLTERIKQNAPDATAIVALEARGFLFAPIVAINLGIKFVPIRKKGKLPGKVENFSYALEYGHDSVEIQSGILTS